MAQEVAKRLSALSGLKVTILGGDQTRRPHPVVELTLDHEQSAAALTMPVLLDKLRNCRPKVLLREDETREDRAYVFPVCLRPGDPEIIANSIGEILRHFADSAAAARSLPPDSARNH